MQVSKIIHRGEKRIKLVFPKNEIIQQELKKIKDSKWSKTQRAWHIPYGKEYFMQLKNMFPNLQVVNNLPNKINNPPNESNRADKITKSKPVITSKVLQTTSYFPKDESCNIVYYGKQILLFMKPNTAIIKQLQNIKGIYFDKDKKAWRLPNKPSNIQIIQQLFNQKVQFLNSPRRLKTNGVNPNQPSSYHQITHPKLVKIVITPHQNFQVYFKYNLDLYQYIKKIKV